MPSRAATARRPRIISAGPRGAIGASSSPSHATAAALAATGSTAGSPLGAAPPRSAPPSHAPGAWTLAFLVEARALHGAQLTFTPHFDTLAGPDQLKINLLAGKSVNDLTSGWDAQLTAFRQQRAQYLLYPND
ncbi:MAG: hypothetical protein ACT4TC_10810 [Myxococcaceae bacterium]